MRDAFRLAILGLATSLNLWSSSAIAGGGIQNNCLDPHWVNALRCKFFPTDPPQPIPAPPAVPSEIKDYTRVELNADPSLRCVDGTNPILYVDRAVNGPSNRWLISMTGGGGCNAEDLDDNGSFESGQACLDDYIEQNTQFMGTAFESAMSNLNTVEGSGILSSDVAINPVFANFNRVRIHKCGFDRHSGRATHLSVSAIKPSPNTPITYDLFNHGQRIVMETLRVLRGQGAGAAGLSFTTWVNQAGTVTPTSQTLPSIADATQVVFVGHSAAGHGLYQNGDRYAETLRAMPGFSGDVRIIHDSHFMPNAENEAAFDPAQNADPLTINTLFDQRVTGNTGAVGAYSSQSYHNNPNSPFVGQYNAWLGAGDDLGDVLDASCYAAHLSAGDTWKCRDRFHVGLHHVRTPALVHEDLSDPNGEHTNAGLGYPVYWGEIAAWSHCLPQFGASPCIAVITNLQAYRARLSIQARHYLTGIHTLSELATGADTSGTPGSKYLWMPYCNTHEGLYNDANFYQSSLVKNGVTTTYRQFVEQFIQAPATGQVVGLVHQLDGAITECGPWLMRNGFE